MKFLVMHITNQKFDLDIFTVGIYKFSSCNMIFSKYPNDFWHKRVINNFDPHHVFLAIAINIPMLLMTGFVV